MAMMDVKLYKGSNVPQEYWERIADYLSCCDAKSHDLDSPTYNNSRWNEEKIYFCALLENLNIPQIYWNTICEEIRCPESGCNGRITQDSVVSINCSYKELKNYQRISNFVSDETKDEIFDFDTFIRKNPKDNRSHPLGIKIASEIAKFKLINLSDRTYFRARRIDKKDPYKKIHKKDMLPPLKEKSFEGRYNRIGERVFYLGEKQFTCVAEINNGNLKADCWMQKVKVNVDKIMDISHYGTPNEVSSIPLFVAGLLFSGIILEHDYSKPKIHPEYAMTHFITDLCRENGIKGILYPSAVMKTQDDKRGANLVLFDWKNHFSFIGEPQRFQYRDKLIELKMKNCKTDCIVEPIMQMFTDI